ncbi:Sec-independent protein translocase TatB [Microbacterium aurantiacum]|uniref:Sec-independent protein translocase TatB n=1 Tax=Microbacterium aurantiacum TaxID=162393 RepID=A0AAJ2HI46_9MICO|nr:Sec-independent protein translocase TatB [Microbacterium aurantiacum]MDS0244266.1 Sec-independent protein translocase TatB [Microbacterium aurantiacum]
MFFGLTIEKVILIAVVGGLLIGPERLPGLAAQLAALVKRVREFGQSAQGRLKEQMGEEFDEVDWKRLDPRQYDPRRIIRDALIEPVLTPGGKTPSEAALAAARRPAAPAAAVSPAGAYDTENGRPSSVDAPAAPGSATAPLPRPDQSS